MRKRIECRVSGRVQMVMYRDFAMRKAKSLGIVGAVKNESDGTVSIVAEGEEERLETFLASLRRGPVLAHVEHVTSRWTEALGVYQDFTIEYR